MVIVELLFAGFISAIGWWGANYYVITPYLPEPIYAEKKADKERSEEEKKKSDKEREQK